MRYRALIAAVLLSAAACACTGNNPNLAAYRAGLHRLDEAIYTDYLAYADEAQAKGTRSADVLFANRRAVQEARAYYNDGAKLLAGPTTAPAAP